MKFTKYALSVSTLALAATAFGASINEPAYNPATVVNVTGTVTNVRQVPSGHPLAGLHLTVQSKTGALDVYLGPPDFLKFLKAAYKAGEQIEVVGSKVKFANAEVLLTRQVDDGYALITLRDPDGAADWQNWGKEVDPTLAQ